jgi:DNA-binding GntR family transcriptional regulator
VIDHEAPTPVYVQVADLLAKRIASGQLALHKPIPSESAIQQEFGVARGTARKAVALLRERGLVYTVPMRGTYAGQPEK